MLRSEAESKAYISDPIKRRKTNVDVAEEVFDPTSENVVERCRKMTGDEAVDVVLNCAGVERAMKDEMNALEFRVWSVR
jgi:threonine dehydrogenase-like Zn-dependent dehydrogenase